MRMRLRPSFPCVSIACRAEPRATRKAMTTRGMRSAVVEMRAIGEKRSPPGRRAFESLIGLAALAAVVLCVRTGLRPAERLPSCASADSAAGGLHAGPDSGGGQRGNPSNQAWSSGDRRHRHRLQRPLDEQAAAVEQRSKRHRVLRFRRMPAGCSSRIAERGQRLCAQRGHRRDSPDRHSRGNESTGDRRRCRATRAGSVAARLAAPARTRRPGASAMSTRAETGHRSDECFAASAGDIARSTMLPGATSTRAAGPVASGRWWSTPVQKAASGEAAASPRSASRPGLSDRPVHCADRRFAPARSWCQAPTGPPRRRLACFCSSLLISLFSSNARRACWRSLTERSAGNNLSFRAIPPRRPALREELPATRRLRFAAQAGARRPSGPVTFSPSRASMSAVMPARSKRGAQPQSTRAALSSSERGQESAIDWRTGST